MSFKEDQNVEAEALESIFPEMEVVEVEPFHSLRFTLKTEKYDEDPDNEVKYPEEAPEVEIEDTENIENEDDILDFLKNQATENLGMPMIYTLVCALIEKLNKDNEDRKINAEIEKERLERQREEEELKRFEGTKVTVEAFLKWKATFDKEMKELKKKDLEQANKKPTGKQLFERDETLFNDVQYMAEGDQVEVDESLFQDLEDLDIEDDEDDEYHPDEDEDEEEEE